MSTSNISLNLFAANVRKKRNALGLTQEKLAELANFDRTYISMVERGKRNISLINVCKLARALNVSPAVLMKGVK